MPIFCEAPSQSRRALLLTGGALFAWGFIPRFARAANGRDPRLVIIILRGALDGLSAVAPIGDPDYAGLHGDLALSLSGDHPAIPLDGFFALNPAMPNLGRLFRAGEASIVHAVATGYRDRSHFDGQDVLESGLPGVGSASTGWLNRALAALPAGERIAGRGGLAVGAAVPLVMRGSAPILGWAPQVLPIAGDDLARRVLAVYDRDDPSLAVALRAGLATADLASQSGLGVDKGKAGQDSPAAMRLAARGTAQLIRADDGPRIAALSFNGWDTHVNEGGATGRLAQLLAGLDGAFEAFEQGLGPVWKDTTIVAVTEFGRTAKINGTVGTDHGTATVAFLAGGAVSGGRVIADWPGLKPGQLHQGRDLAPTSDLRGVLKGVLADQLGLPAAVLGDRIFPGSMPIGPMTGLVRA